MQLPSFLSLVPLASLALAGCYSGGEGWGDSKASVQSTLSSTLCPQNLAGHFTNAQTKSVCLAIGDGIHANFDVQRKGGEADLSTDDCYFYFNREIDGCGNGGSTGYENWIFSADPNAGPC
ncbi:Fc.00g040830.m01.CDS01 [Cosmosporella sp. VM-42]